MRFEPFRMEHLRAVLCALEGMLQPDRGGVRVYVVRRPVSRLFQCPSVQTCDKNCCEQPCVLAELGIYIMVFFCSGFQAVFCYNTIKIAVWNGCKPCNIIPILTTCNKKIRRKTTRYGIRDLISRSLLVICLAELQTRYSRQSWGSDVCVCLNDS